MKTWLKKRLSGEEKKGVERCSPPRSTQESPGSEDFGLQYGESMGDVDDYLSALSSEEDLLDRHLSSAAEEQPVVVHENGVRFEAVLVFRDSATSAPTQAEVWLCPTASMLVVHRRGLLLQMRKSPAMFVLPWEALRVQEAREGMFSVYVAISPMVFNPRYVQRLCRWPRANAIQVQTVLGSHCHNHGHEGSGDGNTRTTHPGCCSCGCRQTTEHPRHK